MTVKDGYDSSHKPKKKYKAVYRGQTIDKVEAKTRNSAVKKLENKTGINKEFLKVKPVNSQTNRMF